jgi:hypothetical protein
MMARRDFLIIIGLGIAFDVLIGAVLKLLSPHVSLATVPDGAALVIAGQLLGIVTWIVVSGRIVDGNGKLTFAGAFASGAVAGVAPFIFLWAVPSLSDPATGLETANLWSRLLAIGISGGLVGVIIAITADVSAEKPAAVFSRALGIPALLVGTVTSLNAKVDASETRAVASASALQETAPTENVDRLEQVSVVEPPRAAGVFASWFAVRAAWAQQPSQQRTDTQSATRGSVFLVVVGEFRTNERSLAERRLRELEGAKLRTERYWPKRMLMYRNPADSSFLLAYSKHSTQLEASRIYALLRINDPRVSPKLVVFRQ